MPKKTLPMDLTDIADSYKIQMRLIEVAFYDWINRSIGVSPYKKTQMSAFLKAHDFDANSIEFLVYILVENEQFKPNQLEYAVLYNQLGNVPQKSAFEVIKKNSVSPVHPGYQGMQFSHTTLDAKLWKEIKEIMSQAKTIPFNYGELKSINIQKEDKNE